MVQHKLNFKLTTKKEQRVCGIWKDINYDSKVKKLNVELIKRDGYYVLQFEDDTKKKGNTIISKPLCTLHLMEAIELKSIIDCLIQDANLDKFDILKEEINTLKRTKEDKM